jgi:chromate reductase
MADSLHVLGISGSLRAASYNTALLRAAATLMPAEMTFEQFDLAPLPMYNQDVNEQGMPDVVQHFRQRIAAADALLIATPEYNHSIPGVLKNAIDWASRPPDQPFNNKPVAIMGASPGIFGTARMQKHLRHVCAALNMHVLNKPEVLIGGIPHKVDEHGTLVDETTIGFLRDQLGALADWTRRLRQA